MQACLGGAGFGDPSYENPAPLKKTICFLTLPITPHIIRGRPQKNPLSVAANGERTNIPAYISKLYDLGDKLQ